jgi:hypothetical protein
MGAAGGGMGDMDEPGPSSSGDNEDDDDDEGPPPLEDAAEK